MKLSFSTLGCPDWNIDEVAKHGKVMGFHGVELRIAGNRHVDPAMPESERRQIKEMFTAAGLTIAAISGYTTFFGNDTARLQENAAVLLKNAELAASLGAPYLRTFMGNGEPPGQESIKILKQACDQAHQLGVTVLLETHDALSTGQQVSEIVKTVNSPGFAILWDIQHSVNAGETPAQTWQYAGEFIRHIHMKDTIGHDPQLMGQGNLPVEEITKLLQANNFDGFVSLEWEKTWRPEIDPPEVALPQYITYMKGLLT